MRAASGGSLCWNLVVARSMSLLYFQEYTELDAAEAGRDAFRGPDGTEKPRHHTDGWRLNGPGEFLTVLAIEQIADRLPPGFVHFALRLAGHRAAMVLISRAGFLRDAARGTTVGKAGFVRPQLELFRTDNANFDRKSHCKFMITQLNEGFFPYFCRKSRM